MFLFCALHKRSLSLPRRIYYKDRAGAGARTKKGLNKQRLCNAGVAKPYAVGVYGVSRAVCPNAHGTLMVVNDALLAVYDIDAVG